MRKPKYATFVGNRGSWWWFDTFTTLKEAKEYYNQYKDLYTCYLFKYDEEYARDFEEKRVSYLASKYQLLIKTNDEWV